MYKRQPQELVDLFQREGIKTNNIIFSTRTNPSSVYESEGDIDLHSIIKILGMKFNIMTQLVKPSTLEFKTGEDKVTLAWNLSVSLYYKAKGIPWKFSEFEDNVCYVGISFFRNFSELSVSMNTSMAQVFLSSGDSFILRGESFEFERKNNDLVPRLDKKNAQNLTNKVLEFYHRHRNHYPSRLVIHKTSNFYEDEIEGIYNNKANLQNIDMITIDSTTKVRLYRQSNYPVMRGTLLSSEDLQECILYSVGLIPSYKTYPGMRIPNPIKIRQFSCNSDIKLICKEILTLSRLDWNNIKFCHRLPVTIEFPRKVGKILSEKRANDIRIESHYRYYM